MGCGVRGARWCLRAFRRKDVALPVFADPGLAGPLSHSMRSRALQWPAQLRSKCVGHGGDERCYSLRALSDCSACAMALLQCCVLCCSQA